MHAMNQPYIALSIVAPNGTRIAQGRKTLEVRAWQPEQLPLKDVVIVENQNYLTQDGDEEPGLAVAIADILQCIHGARMSLRRLAQAIGLKAILPGKSAMSGRSVRRLR